MWRSRGVVEVVVVLADEVRQLEDAVRARLSGEAREAADART